MPVTISRRELILMLGGAAAAWPRVVRAQQPERMRRVGVLMIQAADDPVGQARAKAFQRGLQQLGCHSDQYLAGAMSAMGQKRTFRQVRPSPLYPQKRTWITQWQCPLCAISGLIHRSKASKSRSAGRLPRNSSAED